jgi:hypothetical protein
VRYHPGPKAFSLLGQEPEHQSKRAEQYGGFCSLIGVARAESSGGEEQAGSFVAGPSGELLLEIATEDTLFADSGGHGNSNP